MVTVHWIDALMRTALHARSKRTGLAGSRARHDRGEGVISAAIAVLIMAFLGAAMWLGFNRMWKTTETTTNQKVQQIGSDAP
ncbi:MAG: hypothetical protein N2037_01050 [Acidimicrobiales bacterium]|nr:hypothetical protein [Acidimicrobiales bacterium]